MLTKSITILTLAAAAFAAPQVNFDDLAASLTSNIGALATGIDIDSLTSDLGSLTSFDAGSLSSELNAATSLIGILSGIPTLPTSVLSVLETAVPVSELTQTQFACHPTAGSWYNSLPADVKSALTSYQSALSTWAAGHSDVLSQYTGDLSVPVCTGTAGGATTAKSTTMTGTQSTARNTGATGSAGAASTARGTATSSTNSPGAAPRATAIIGSVAGIVGALGVMVAL